MNNGKDIWVENMMRYAARSTSSFNAKDEVFEKIQIVLDRPEIQSKILSFNQFRLAGIAALLIMVLNLGVIGFTITQKDYNAESRPLYSLTSYDLDLY